MNPYTEDQITRISDSINNHNATMRYRYKKLNPELPNGSPTGLIWIPMFKPNVLWRMWHFIKREVISLKNV